MTELVAALPMYDWPEVRAEVDAEWAAIRDRLRAVGIDAPERLARRNADLPPIPGGIRDVRGAPAAPDPRTLAPHEFDFATLWRHPALLLGQTCWGPMETTGLAGHVRVIGQPDYSGFEGGEGTLYSSAIVMRQTGHVRPPTDGRQALPLALMRGARLAFNERGSMSGFLALQRDLGSAGESMDIFAERLETGGHRESIVAVAEGRADVCAVDCRSWALARQFEPAAADVAVVGWTARRRGLPYIASPALPDRLAGLVSDSLAQAPRSRVSSG